MPKGTLIVALFIECLVHGQSHAQISLLGSFRPQPVGQLNAIGFDASSETLYVHVSRSREMHEYSPSGVLLNSIPDNLNQGNDSDLDFASVPIQMGQSEIPAHTLLVTANNVDPPRFSAVNKATGDVLAQIEMDRQAIGQLTGGSYSPSTNSLFVIDWSEDWIHEIELSDGGIRSTFGFGDDWDAFFSDLDVAPGTNRLFLVSSTQPSIRVLESDGTFVHDIDVSRLGIQGMSGIAFEDETGHAWISSTSGTVYHIADLASARPCGPLGDFDCNESLDAVDIDRLSAQVRTGVLDSFFDINHDRRMNAEDRATWVHELKQTYFGDADLDGEFNTGDLVAVFVSGEFDDDLPMNSTWVTGDWNGDGDFGSGDIVLAFVDGGFEQGPRVAVIPEPTSYLLMSAGLLAIAHLGRRENRTACFPS